MNTNNEFDAAAAQKTFEGARQDFINQWGVMGGAWGINRTMAQIHALLLVSEEPLSTDEVMAQLQISRGNAHTNLKDLVDWGIVQSVLRTGERKEFFKAERDVWKMFCIIARERKRREVEPALAVLRACAEQSGAIPCESARRFNKQMKDLCEFTEIFSGMLERLAGAERSKALPLAMKMLK